MKYSLWSIAEYYRQTGKLELYHVEASSEPMVIQIANHNISLRDETQPPANLELLNGQWYDPQFDVDVVVSRVSE